MKQMINRFSRDGKSSNEKEAYRKFLHSKFKLEKTEKDLPNPNKTDESDFESDKVEEAEITKKSLKLRFRDWLNNNWVIAIGGSLIVALIIFLIGEYGDWKSSVGSQDTKISNIETNVGKIESSVENNKNSINALNIFKAEASKDIEFLKLNKKE